MNAADAPALESADASRPEVARGRAVYLLISLAVLLADQASKWLVESQLALHETWRAIPGLLNFVYVRNTGVAFGLFPAHGDIRGTLMLAGAGLLALVFVAWYFWTAPADDRALLVALALIMGGAVGNLLDRLVQGGVTDFIDFNFRGYHWHTFNIADSAISIGIALMVLGTLRPQPKPKNDDTAAEGGAPVADGVG